MRYLAPVFVIFAIVTTVAVWMLTRSPDPQPVAIAMSSNPFPMYLGANTLEISLTQPDGTLVRDAEIEVIAQMDMDGMLLPQRGVAEMDENGVYHFPVLWSMMGEWIVDIQAQLPDERVLVDQFDVFVYAVPQTVTNPNASYQSDSALASQSRKDNEAWIVIPLGTEMLYRTGSGDDIMPNELRLSVSGVNTLVIQNNDIADHYIGPFYIRAGETLRQTFTEPAEFVGACSVSHSEQISVVVES